MKILDKNTKFVKHPNWYNVLEVGWGRSCSGGFGIILLMESKHYGSPFHVEYKEGLYEVDKELEEEIALLRMA